MKNKMRHTIAGLPLAILFIANVFPSSAQSVADPAAAEAEELVEVVAGAPLRLRCSLRPEQQLQWRREGGPLPADLLAPAEAPAGRSLEAELLAAAASPAHAGRYSCAAGGRTTRLVVLPAESARTPEPASDLVVHYEVRGNLSIQCPLAADLTQPIIWSKNGSLVSEVEELKNRYSVSADGRTLQVSGRSSEDDHGNYSCSAGSEPGAARGRVLVLARTHAKLPANTNVVEGQKLKLTCRLVGKPYPQVTWLFANGTWENGTDALAALGAERVQLRESEQGAAGAELVVREARRADAGLYTCVPAGGAPASSTLRVKDMYAALWPFLGIVAEVVALCAVILVYERRRGKPEPEDSDADHDHDQKKS